MKICRLTNFCLGDEALDHQHFCFHFSNPADSKLNSLSSKQWKFLHKMTFFYLQMTLKQNHIIEVPMGPLPCFSSYFCDSFVTH